MTEGKKVRLIKRRCGVVGEHDEQNGNARCSGITPIHFLSRGGDSAHDDVEIHCVGKCVCLRGEGGGGETEE